METTFRISAKTDVGMVRTNNEDSLQCCDNLMNSSSDWSWDNDKPTTLSQKGALLIVADGMGGMNAGEVASEIAINTIKECFSTEKITDEVVKSRYSIERFMNAAIIEADSRIKMTAKQRPETKGMGTTVVMGWIFEDKLYVSWCGDSRAYVYNPNSGLKRLSTDHSLVQELVDSGKISKEDAFDYPESNVITRSLCAIPQKAEPDSLRSPHTITEGDIILLCSDGLCGMIRDAEIQNVIEQHLDNTIELCDALISAAKAAGGHDNVTVALCKIDSTPQSQKPAADEASSDANKEEAISRKTNKGLFFSVGFVIVSVIVALLIFKPWRDVPKVKMLTINEASLFINTSHDTLFVSCGDTMKFVLPFREPLKGGTKLTQDDTIEVTITGFEGNLNDTLPKKLSFKSDYFRYNSDSIRFEIVAGTVDVDHPKTYTINAISNKGVEYNENEMALFVYVDNNFVVKIHNIPELKGKEYNGRYKIELMSPPDGVKIQENETDVAIGLKRNRNGKENITISFETGGLNCSLDVALKRSKKSSPQPPSKPEEQENTEVNDGDEILNVTPSTQPTDDKDPQNNE